MQPRVYRVYVIELSPEAIPSSKRTASVRGAVYVGHTAHSPERRFEQHKLGGKLSSYKPRRYGVRLRPDLCARVGPFSSRSEAEQAEERLAKKLEAKGYVVYWG